MSNNLNNSNSHINAPSNKTMAHVKKGLTHVKKTYRTTKEAFGKIPMIQKIIIVFIALFILIYIIKSASGIFTMGMGKANLPIKYECADNQLFTGIIKNIETSVDAECGYCEIKNPDYETCCKIDSKLFNEQLPGQFTYSFWLYISSFNPGFVTTTISNEVSNNWKHVWHRGSDIILSGDAGSETWTKVVQYPGVWLSPGLKDIIFEINTSNVRHTVSGEKPIERIQLTIEDYNQWVNYAIVLNNYTVTIYRNGKIEKTVLIQNYINDIDIVQGYDIYLGGNKIRTSHDLMPLQTVGFPGYLAYLVYFNESYNPGQIEKLYKYYKKNIDKYITESRYIIDSINNAPLNINKELGI